MVWKFAVTEGPYEGRWIWKYNGLDTVDKIGYLKKDLLRIGFSLKYFSHLEREMVKLENQHVELAIKNKQEWQNVYLLKRVNSTSEH